jgi:sugar phosphate isomerase/epimerase
VEAVAPFVRTLVRAGITLAIENTPATGPEAFNALFSRLSDLCLAPHYAGMCFDLGHANLCASTRNDYLQYLDKLDPRVPIIHVHAHENYGDGDTHLPLFTGPAATDGAGITGFVARMKLRRFSGSVILEQWPDPPSMLNHARERLLRMFAE